MGTRAAPPPPAGLLYPNQHYAQAPAVPVTTGGEVVEVDVSW